MRWAMLVGALTAIGVMIGAVPADAARYAMSAHTPGAGRTSGTGIPHAYAGAVHATPHQAPHFNGSGSHSFMRQGR